MRESQKPIVDGPTDNFILPVNAKKNMYKKYLMMIIVAT